MAIRFSDKNGGISEVVEIPKEQLTRSPNLGNPIDAMIIVYGKNYWSLREFLDTQPIHDIILKYENGILSHHPR